MDHPHLLARRLGGVPLLVVILSCLALILAGCRCSSARAAPVFVFPAAAAKVAHAVARHDHERLRVALHAAVARVGEALGALAAVTLTPAATSSSSLPMLEAAAAAREDCAELLDEALLLLAGARAAAARGDALTWLSAALTNHDTCADSLAEAGASLHAHPHLAVARAVVRDTLAMMYASSTSTVAEAAAATRTTTEEAGGAAGSCCKNETRKRQGPCGFPRWLPARNRRLVLAPAASLVGSADIVVAKDGTGTHATIADAVRAAPECSDVMTGHMLCIRVTELH